MNPWLKVSAFSFFSYYELKFVVIIIIIIIIIVVAAATRVGAAVAIILFPSIRLQNLLYIRWTSHL